MHVSLTPFSKMGIQKNLDWKRNNFFNARSNNAKLAFSEMPQASGSKQSKVRFESENFLGTR